MVERRGGGRPLPLAPSPDSLTDGLFHVFFGRFEIRTLDLRSP